MCPVRSVTYVSGRSPGLRPLKRVSLPPVSHSKIILPTICQLSGQADADAVTAFRAELLGQRCWRKGKKTGQQRPASETHYSLLSLTG